MPFDLARPHEEVRAFIYVLDGARFDGGGDKLRGHHQAGQGLRRGEPFPSFRFVLIASAGDCASTTTLAMKNSSCEMKSFHGSIQTNRQTQYYDWIALEPSQDAQPKHTASKKNPGARNATVTIK